MFEYMYMYTYVLYTMNTAQNILAPHRVAGKGSLLCEYVPARETPYSHLHVRLFDKKTEKEEEQSCARERGTRQEIERARES